MANGADARMRTDRAVEFTDNQRIWLLERDLDLAEKSFARKLEDMQLRNDKRFDAMQTTLRRISSACIAIMTFLVGSLILLVVQQSGGR